MPQGIGSHYSMNRCPSRTAGTPVLYLGERMNTYLRGVGSGEQERNRYAREKTFPLTVLHIRGQQQERIVTSVGGCSSSSMPEACAMSNIIKSRIKRRSNARLRDTGGGGQPSDEMSNQEPDRR